MSRIRILCCVLLTVLMGCQMASHRDFSMSESDWQALSDEAKQPFLKQYDVAHRPSLHHLTGVRALSTQYPTVTVMLERGTALMWPGHQRLAFTPTRFDVRAGTCQRKVLTNKAQTAETSLQVCYDGQTLRMDPSHWHTPHLRGSLMMHASMMWAQGMTYPALSSEGYAQLKHAIFFVKQA